MTAACARKASETLFGFNEVIKKRLKIHQKGTHLPKRSHGPGFRFCLIWQAKAWNDDFDRGKSEQLKTKRIERSRNITSRQGALGTARTPRRQAGTTNGVQKASTIESQNSVASKRYKFCPDHGGMLGFAWGLVSKTR